MSDHFLFLSVPDRGHVFPYLAAVEELVRRGHRVTYVSGDEVAEAVRSTGADFLPYESAHRSADVYRLVTAENDSSTFQQQGLDFILLLLAEGKAMLDAAQRTLGTAVPDLVAYDLTVFHAGRALALTWGKPAIKLIPTFASNEHYSNVQTMLDPEGQGAKSSLGEIASMMTIPGFGEVVEELTRFLDELGIDMPVSDFWSYVEERNLVHLPRAFQYAGDTFDERFVFVGPCVGERSFLGEWAPPGNGLPVVLVSLGTVCNAQHSFFRMCVEAFRDVPAHVVMTLGQEFDSCGLGPLPPSIEVREWAPHLSVLPHAKAFVTHGGMASVVESLYSGCPALVVPLTADARATGRRVAELGLGRTMQVEEVTAEALRETVLDLMADEAATGRVGEMRQHCLAAGGTSRAADVFEAQVRRSR
ncbi:oleandomycin glycosyltransferase [Streptomyces sp. AV19]|uniref:macrolide family glycosyltransferase n=1 Tax=Streptomyces sp. AV19 TaxID=2793068 RepID=UPI0018FEAAA1|nr:macrolide family glycosyltransferase [Streptomyces sp. AV19]MBH1937775.1 oleandomycin glycosyltransferase [Streptomyces sp. AV19]MDG4533663.1 oleandomycin glycosyltransferase [Streptomyces sp. AV19]